MSRITLQGLTKVFRGPSGEEVRALDGIDLTVDNEEMVVLLGPSGCGKTTMLRCIAGLEQPTDGTIEIAGSAVYSAGEGIEVPPDRRNLGMVFQSYALWPHMTVADNVAYPLKRRKVPKADIGGRVSDSLSLVDCGHLADRYPHELSGGQQQRISLARALVAEPRVLLFDEPLSNLDAGLRDRMRSEIRAVQMRSGYTSVYVTHDQREALAIADRLVVMRDGHILQSGQPEEIYARPTTAFVADFLGASNLIPVTKRHGLDEVDTPLGKLRVTANGPDPSPDETVSVSVRQESIAIHNGQDVESTNVVTTHLTVAEFLGDHRLAVFEANDVMLRAKLPVGTDLRPGEEYRIAIPMDEAHLVLR